MDCRAIFPERAALLNFIHGMFHILYFIKNKFSTCPARINNCTPVNILYLNKSSNLDTKLCFSIYKYVCISIRVYQLCVNFVMYYLLRMKISGGDNTVRNSSENPKHF